jgi:hypothetical protein
MAATAPYKLKLDAVLDSTTNCLVLHLQGNPAPLPSAYTFYTGTSNQVEVTVFFPVAGGTLIFAGNTYVDSDNNTIITVQCAVNGDYEIEPSTPTTTAPTTTSLPSRPTQPKPPIHGGPIGGPIHGGPVMQTAEAAGGTERSERPRAPGTRVRLLPKIGYPPSGGDDT